MTFSSCSTGVARPHWGARSISALLLAFGLLSHCTTEPAAPGAIRSNDTEDGAASSDSAAQGLAPGQAVEDFEALTQTGYLARLTQLVDKPLAILFCSQLDGRCETMAQTVRDHWYELTREFEMVAMITPSGWTETRSFSSRLKLPQLLLTDRDGKIAQAFGLPPSQAKYHAYVVGRDRAILQAFTDLEPNRIHSILLSDAANSGRPLP